MGLDFTIYKKKKNETCQEAWEHFREKETELAYGRKSWELVYALVPDYEEYYESEEYLDYVAEKTDTWEELLKSDIIPFVQNRDKTDLIMLSHISFPNVTGTNLPTTLSDILITNKLRTELRYRGVIITDSFHMGAIINNYTSDEAAILAVKAGVDIILMPDDYLKAFEALVTAVKTGEIPEQRINESVLRILKLKEKLGAGN